MNLPVPSAPPLPSTQPDNHATDAAAPAPAQGDYVPYEAPPVVGPQAVMVPLSLGAPFRWLRLGARDMAALRFVRAVAACQLPIVAAVDGVAIGIGTTMLLHCDLVYASPAARFRLPFVDLGLVPEAGASLLLPARIGQARASEMLMLGAPIEADTAREYGLDNGVIEAAELPAHALAQAQAIAAKPRNALRATRHLMRGDRAAVMARIDEEAQIFAQSLVSREARDAFAAFMMKGKA